LLSVRRFLICVGLTLMWVKLITVTIARLVAVIPVIEYFIWSPSLLQSTNPKSGILADDINTADDYAIYLSLSGISNTVDSRYANQPRYKLRWDRASCLCTSPVDTYRILISLSGHSCVKQLTAVIIFIFQTVTILSAC